MPNHIKNRIELIGSENDIKELVDSLSTFYPSTPYKSHDGDLVFQNKETSEYGWLNETTNVFTQRNKADAIGVPNGFTQDFEAEWTRFPDFNKIVPMPKGLEVECHLGIEDWVEICTQQIDFSSVLKSESKTMGEEWIKNGFKSMINSMKASTALKLITGKERSVKDFSDKDFETFVQCLRNYRTHGYISWYKWSQDKWGTKWNAYSCEKISNNVFEFETAWSGIPDLIKMISERFPNVTIVYKYSDEDTGSNCGLGDFTNGQTNFVKLENQSIEAYNLAFELRPDRLKDYKLVNNKYEYAEED